MFLYYAHVLCLAASKLGPFVVAVASGGGEGGDEGGHGGEMTSHLPSLVYYLDHYLHAPWMEHWVNVIFAFIVALAFMVLARIVYAKRQMIPGPFQNAIELIVESLYNFFYSILGKEARRYTPFLGTLFLYILALNWIGMIPLGHSPSTSLSITLSLAVLVFLYVQGIGVKRLGVLGYIHHLAGSPNDVIGWSMVIIMLPIHIIGELAKPVSLALRLFGNITGEDTLIAVFVGMGIAITPFIGDFVGIPLQTPFYFLGLLLSTIQALVFTLLSTIYILLMLPHEEHEH